MPAENNPFIVDLGSDQYATARDLWQTLNTSEILTIVNETINELNQVDEAPMPETTATPRPRAPRRRTPPADTTTITPDPPVRASCWNCSAQTLQLPERLVLGAFGRWYCESCLPMYVVQCRYCNNRAVRGGSSTYYIRTASPTQGEQEDILDDNPNADVFRTEFACTSCYNRRSLNEQVLHCRVCGHDYDHTVPAGRMYIGTYTCRCCHSTQQNQLNGVMNYTTNVLAHLNQYDSPKDNLLMGVELEVQTVNFDPARQARHVRGILPQFAICKKDGSIGEHGFEIVTVPASIEGHRKEWDKLFNDLPRVTSWKGGQCGMHVHIARKALSPLKIGKMLVFVNSPNNAPLVSSIAGRYSTHYTRILDKKISDGNAQGLNHDNRYEAINLTNSATVEVRIFRGTVKRESFYKNLEFCHALVKFVGVAGISDLTSPKFSAFVAESRRDYPYLFEFLRQREYIVGKAPSVRSANPEKQSLAAGSKVFANV